MTSVLEHDAGGRDMATVTGLWDRTHRNIALCRECACEVCEPGYPHAMVRTLKRNGRHGGHAAAGQTAETARISEAGAGEQGERPGAGAPRGSAQAPRGGGVEGALEGV